jgi:hypothetical protein
MHPSQKRFGKEKENSTEQQGNQPAPQNSGCAYGFLVEWRGSLQGTKVRHAMRLIRCGYLKVLGQTGDNAFALNANDNLDLLE